MRPLHLAFAPLFLVVAPLQAAEPTNMLTIDGTCENLMVEGVDLTDDCNDAVIQMVYDIGRVGLYASSGNTIVTFSGASDEVVGNEVHQQLDQVLIGSSETDIRTIPARGTCTFENPYDGVEARFTCSARAKSGAIFELSFLTDGKAPVDVMAD